MNPSEFSSSPGEVILVYCKMMSLSYKAAAEGVRLPWPWCQHWEGLVGAIQSIWS